ncbi:sulfite exporter TauE/SafE family protein [Streptomyces iconiensis]|uniref:Probable membrane transporter protein n=1 Tax=Streptomyces iconiensis TaxID=1384038 RepID=A0ABT7ACK3_9ACTN|nr:sulfite exporter TauE/SafE family protein [Streptomyces iconiensis]MDJ1138343.1 sulfite exporter TauE/SafE family protein [Streptomyces iconiensis]
MTTVEMVAVLLAGVGAGGINAVVGSGSLITFPVLLATGMPPVTATVSNALGVIPGSLTGALGYREELRGQGRRLLRLGTGALLGGFTGATLLLTLPAAAFERIVPVLVGLALVLVVLQPWLSRAVRRRREAAAAAGEHTADEHMASEHVASEHAGSRPGRTRRDGGPLLYAGLTLASVYGGYFAAAQGILYIALMGMLLDETLHRLNAAKNVLVALVNAVAALFFLFVADFSWTAVALIAAGSALGGHVGARIGRRLSPTVLRGLVVAVGGVALVHLLR